MTPDYYILKNLYFNKSLMLNMEVKYTKEQKRFIFIE